MPAMTFISLLVLGSGSSPLDSINDRSSWPNQLKRDIEKALKDYPELRSADSKEKRAAQCHGSDEPMAGYACLLLGKELPDREADPVFRRRCDLGNAQACISIADQSFLLGRGSLAGYARACELGNMHGCLFLALRREAKKYRLEELRKGNDQRLSDENRVLLKRACDDDIALACSWLATYVSVDDDNLEGALSLWQKACKIGYRKACLLYENNATEEGLGVPENFFPWGKRQPSEEN